MTRLPLIALLLLGQDAADIDRSIAALTSLKDDDEDGFDQHADKLMKAGPAALAPLEKKMNGLSGTAAFRLKRVHDMITWPISIRGAYAYRVGNAYYKQRNSLEVGMIVTALNGRPVTSWGEYQKVAAEFRAKKEPTARFDGFLRGRPIKAECAGFTTGLSWLDYPSTRVEFLHRGHRGAAWDEDAQEGLLKAEQEITLAAGRSLETALEKGCRDPVVLREAMEAYRKGGDPASSLKIWTNWGGKARTTMHGGGPYRQAHCEAGQAAVESGDVENARKLLADALGKAEAAGDKVSAAHAIGLQAALVGEKEPEKAVELYRSALTRIKSGTLHERWSFNLMHHLKLLGRNAELEEYAGVFDTLETRQRDAHKQALKWMTEQSAAPKEIIPKKVLYSSEATAAKGGDGDGLLGTYFAQNDLQGKSVTRVDPQIKFDWGEGSPHPEMPTDNFSVRWTGFLVAPASGACTLISRTDDGVRLWLDGTLLIDVWKGQAPTEYSKSVKLEAGKRYALKMEMYDGIRGAVAELYWSGPATGVSPAAPKAPQPWALVYRQNFDVPAAVPHLGDQHRLFGMMRADNRALRYDVEGSGTGFFTWGSYGPDVRVELDGRLVDIPDQEAGPSCGVSVDTLFTYRGQTEVGCGFVFPRWYRSDFLFSNHGFTHYAPWLDARKPHRLSTQCVQGRVEHRVDGRLADIQFVPAWWHGRAGARCHGATSEIDNFEIYVPTDAPFDLERQRRLYDAASAAWIRGDIDAALGSLEEAAAQQPRVDELGHLYASYVVAWKRGREAGWAKLDERLRKVSNRRAFEMLLWAEQFIDLFNIEGEEEFEDVRSTHIGTDDGRYYTNINPDPKKLQAIGASNLSGRLAVYTRAYQVAFERGRGKKEEVEQAYKRAIEQDKRKQAHKYRLARFYQAQGNAPAASPILAELSTAYPFLKEGK